MKKILISLALVATTSFANTSTFTFNDLLLKKDLANPLGISFTGYLSVKAWCLQQGTAFGLGSFQAARELEKLDDGLLRCQGQFVRLPYEPIQVFQIDNCTRVNPQELKLQCENN